MVGRTVRRIASLFLVVVLNVGCGSGQPQGQAAGTDKPASRPRLADLLNEPRAELARQADEVAAQIKVRFDARRQSKLAFSFLPRTWQPLVIPGIHDPRFHPEIGFSLPSYLEPTAVGAEPDLALLYAAFGDKEAARKLAGGEQPPGIQRFQYARNYPVEWTRLVTLHLHAAGQRMALGQPEGFTEIVELRKQIAEALDDQARQAPLGMHLLALERRMVELAEQAWREKGETALAQQAAALLAEWPRQVPPLPFDELTDHWVRVLRSSAQGRVLRSSSALRSLDFLQVPFPHQSLEAVLLFFDEQNRLSDVILTYNARIQDLCPRATELAGALTAWVTPDPEPSPTRSVQRLRDWTVETRLGPVDARVGAWVRFSRSTGLVPSEIPRSWGPVHLNRRFETNRLAVAPNRLDEPLVVKEDAALERFDNPLPNGQLLDVTLYQATGFDLLQRVRMRYRPGTPWQDVALPLFAQLGPGEWLSEQAGSTHGPRLRIRWQDAITQISFCVPYEPREPLELDLADLRGSPDDLQKWNLIVEQQEEAERRQRLARGTPLQRLPRKLEYLPLGAEKDETLRYLPKGQNVLKREFDNGILVVINTPPPREGPPFMARQVVCQFGADNKLIAARIRYDAATKPRNPKDAEWPKSLLEPWRQAGGVVAPTVLPYALRSTGLAPTPAGVYYRWQDDLSEASYLSDRNGVEITLANRPVDGNPVPKLHFLPTGPADALPGLTLGMTRAEFEKSCKARPVETPEGGWAVAVSQGTYDAVIVWFDEQDRIRQITARFRANDPSKTSPKDMEKALTDRWGLELRQVGWPARRDFSSQGVLQGLVWFDDVVRYRLYWADSDNSPPRLWAEWLALEGPASADARPGEKP